MTLKTFYSKAKSLATVVLASAVIGASGCYYLSRPTSNFPVDTITVKQYPVVNPEERKSSGSFKDLVPLIEPAKAYAVKGMRNQETGRDIQEMLAHIQERLAHSAPLIAKELSRSSVNIPSLEFSNLEDYGAVGLYDIKHNKIILDVISYSTLIHEIAHANSSLLLLFFPEKRETFAKVLTMEVLANEALEGNCNSLYIFSENLEDMLIANMYKDRNTSRRLLLSTPARIIAETVKGKRESYKGIRLDAIDYLINVRLPDIASRQILAAEANTSQKESLNSDNKCK